MNYFLNFTFGILFISVCIYGIIKRRDSRLIPLYIVFTLIFVISYSGYMFIEINREIQRKAYGELVNIRESEIDESLFIKMGIARSIAGKNSHLGENFISNYKSELAKALNKLSINESTYYGLSLDSYIIIHKKNNTKNVCMILNDGKGNHYLKIISFPLIFSVACGKIYNCDDLYNLIQKLI
jgi:hypothetical protein